MVSLLVMACQRSVAEAPRAEQVPGASGSPGASGTPAGSGPQSYAEVPGSRRWNGSQIQWRSWDDGLAESRRTGRPMIAVLHATWCRTCRSYRRIFYTFAAVEKAKQVVMVLVDVDQQAEIANKLTPDGRYVPRNFAIDARGMPRLEIVSSNPKYKYFLDPSQPSGFTAFVDRVLQ